MNRARGERSADNATAGHPPPRTRNASAQSGLTWPPALPFEQTLRQAQAADQQAMGMLYKRFLPVVYRYALAHVGDVHAAEDVTSETFFTIVEHISETRARDELGFVAWALGIARNKVAMHFRRQRARPDAQFLSDQLDFIGHQPHERDPLEVITARESWGEVVAALDRLTEEQRAVILYRSVLGYSAEDVGQLLGKQPGAVRALQFRALASLARFLEGAGSDVLPPTEGASRTSQRGGEE